MKYGEFEGQYVEYDKEFEGQYSMYNMTWNLVSKWVHTFIYRHLQVSMIAAGQQSLW